MTAMNVFNLILAIGVVAGLVAVCRTGHILAGRTNEEAAKLMGCPKGTVLSRLSWARERLRKRLTRRGLAPPAVMLTATLTSSALRAAVPQRHRHLP